MGWSGGNDHSIPCIFLHEYFTGLSVQCTRISASFNICEINNSCNKNLEVLLPWGKVCVCACVVGGVFCIFSRHTENGMPDMNLSINYNNNKNGNFRKEKVIVI